MASDNPIRMMQARMMCVVCNHLWVAQFPEGTDYTKLECTACGAQVSTLEPAPPSRQDTDEDDGANWWKTK